MKWKGFLILALCLFAILPLSAETLKVAVAANFSQTMEAIRNEFLKDKQGLEIAIIPGSSGKLSAQILTGADFDLFLSADTGYPEKLQKAGFSLEEPVGYAVGKLVMVAIRPIDLSVGLWALTNSSVKRVVVANPGLAPYGKAAMEALSNAGLLQITNKIVYTEDISQAMGAVLTSVEIGFTARALLFSPSTLKYNIAGKYFIEVAPKLYHPLAQSLVLLKNGKSPSRAKELVEFILSPAGREIIGRFGYGEADKEK